MKNVKNMIIPAGSVILTPDEVARLRALIAVAHDAPLQDYVMVLSDVGREIRDILDDSKPLEGEN